MASTDNNPIGDNASGTKTTVSDDQEIVRQDLHKGHLHISGSVEDITKLHHRNPIIHWSAFVFSVISFVISLYWILSSQQNIPGSWIWIEVGLSVFFGLEFLTRSGLRWHPTSYLRTRFFDFVAVVPVLVLVYYQVPHLQVWAWIILLARFGRVIDRVLGDGFWTRNLFALLEGFEEEITDRVMLRIMSRVREDLARGSFGRGLAQALEQNKQNLLQQVHTKHPTEGVSGVLGRFGINSALERAEEYTFDAIVEIIKSPEVDLAIRDAVDSAFVTMQKNMETKSWRQNLGIKPKADGNKL